MSARLIVLAPEGMAFSTSSSSALALSCTFASHHHKSFGEVTIQSRAHWDRERGGPHLLRQHREVPGVEVVVAIAALLSSQLAELIDSVWLQRCKSERSAREQRKRDNFVSKKTGASIPVGLAPVGNARIVGQQQHPIALLGRSLDDRTQHALGLCVCVLYLGRSSREGAYKAWRGAVGEGREGLRAVLVGVQLVKLQRLDADQRNVELDLLPVDPLRAVVAVLHHLLREILTPCTACLSVAQRVLVRSVCGGDALRGTGL